VTQEGELGVRVDVIGAIVGDTVGALVGLEVEGMHIEALLPTKHSAGPQQLSQLQSPPNATQLLCAPSGNQTLLQN